MEDISAVNDAPVVRLLDKVLQEAVRLKASDIHFEAFSDGFKVRCRVDGVIIDLTSPPPQLFAPVISRIKVLANLDVAESRVPQDGRLAVNIGDKDIDMRVSTLPTVFGESVVLRVLDKDQGVVAIDELGMWEDDLPRFKSLFSLPNGLVLVTGPTGSGKTTTLYSFMSELNSVERKIITTEDPVEYDMPGAVQIPIDSKIGLDFSTSLRTILRQDPDIIMVGEIRDEETAQIAVQAALTGHLVLSTLHTNNAPGAITRLIDMGIEPYLITSTLRAVIAQRLVRKICPHCIDTYHPSEAEKEAFGLNDGEDLRFFKGSGCDKCNNSGYKGRTALFEFLEVKDDLHFAIMQRVSTAGIRDKAIQMGMVTIREDGLRKARRGITTLEEVFKETQL